LIIDVHHIDQQARANAFAGSIISITNVAGFLIGSIDLVTIFPFILNVGDQDVQLKILCFISTTMFCITVSTTCIFIKEEPTASNSQMSKKFVLSSIFNVLCIQLH
jgi:solute carrier family 45 protein 1/2/4